MDALGQQHERNEWPRFFNSSRLNLKDTLLHNENKYPTLISLCPSYEEITKPYAPSCKASVLKNEEKCVFNFTLFF